MQIRHFRIKFAAKWLLHALVTWFSHFAHSGKWEWKVDWNAVKQNRIAFWDPFSYSATKIMQIRDFGSKFVAKWLLQVCGTVFSLGTALFSTLNTKIDPKMLCDCSSIDVLLPLATVCKTIEYNPAHLQKSFYSKFAFEFTSLHYFCRWTRKQTPKCFENSLPMRSSRLFITTCHCVQNFIFRWHFSNAFP